MIKLRIYKWEDYPGFLLSGWSQCSHKGTYKKQVGRSELEKRCDRGSRDWSDAL